MPALVAWAVLAALVGAPAGVLAALGSGSALCALVLLRVRVGAPAAGPWRGQGAATLAAVALVALAAAAHLARDRAGPVPGWAQEGATATVVATVTTEPRLITRGDERPGLVILELRAREVAARGRTVRSAAPVLVMATEGDGWQDLRWRSTVRAEGTLRAPQPGDRAVALLVPRAAPLTEEPPGPVLRAADHVRDRFRAAVAPLPADPRGLVPGLVIGDTSLTPEELTADMRATGLTHLSAVSGTNVTEGYAYRPVTTRAPPP